MDLPLVKKAIHNTILIGISLLSFVGFFSFILIFSSTIKWPIKTTRYLNKFESRNQDSYYYKALDPKNSSIIFNTTVFVLWQVIAIANIIGLFLSLSVFEKTLLGTNLLFKSTFVDQFFYNTEIIFTQILSTNYKYYNGNIFHKIIMLIFSLPALSFLFLIIRKNIKSALEGYSLLKKQSDMYGKIEKQLSEQINEVCKSANVRPPIIKVVESPDIKAETKYLGFPIFKNILIISIGAWNELHTNKDELDALLAHEIWHIKKHTLTRKLLCFLSDYSLFGNGFLALFQNSFQIEKEADDFAVKWLTKKHQDENKAISSLKSLLERIEETNWTNAFFQPSNSLNFAMFKEASYRNDLLKMYDNSSRSERLKINLKLLYQMYFGDEILSYFHPSINQRIAWVEETINEAN
jgi:Zn-dependent protease with chaperone function